MGYFDGRQSAKVWLVSAKDLKVMYEKANSSCEISLWVQTCEDIDAEEDSDINPEPSRKKGKQQSKEDKLEEIYGKLKNQHDKSTYNTPQLKLWA